MKPQQLKKRLPAAALAFRGYNVTNLGRSRELLAHAGYGPVLAEYLRRGSDVCRQFTGRRVDLVARVEKGVETSLETYADAVALVMAVEIAQLRMLEEFFDIDYRGARYSFGFSLGELAALVAGGTIGFEEALKIPLSLVQDCIDLAADVTLAVLFTRALELPQEEIRRHCLMVNQEGRGVLGVSAHLSPNSLLMMGQGDTLDRFRERLGETPQVKAALRKNDHRWPPLHTPIVWERSVPNRAAVLMHTIDGLLRAPKPNVLSLVTGKLSYTDTNARDILHQWIDHPQRLWDAVYETLAGGIETVIHVGPSPNIIPATFQRICDNVDTQLKTYRGLRAVSAVVTRPWLASLLPARTALLRAPLIRQVVLEDWLLAQ